MKISTILSLVIAFMSITSLAFGQLEGVKTKKFKTITKLKIEGDVGYLIVPENRNDPSSRKIKIKYAHLKSLSPNPAAPLMFLEGGGSTSTWQVNSPKDLTDWIEILEVSDMIFIDQRGTSDKALNYIWRGEFPKDFFVSEAKAEEHYKIMMDEAFKSFEEANVDVAGYHVVEHAKDVNALADALGIDKYSIYGFSFGSHIGMTSLQLFPDRIDRAIFAGADAPHQSFNFPSYLDKHVEKLGVMVANDPTLSSKIPDFSALATRVMKKLEANPVTITVKNPLTRKSIPINVGAFGLGVVLRLDIDDASDIPVIPRLLYSIDNGNYDLLTWFVQKRLPLAMVVPGGGLNQGLASGVSQERWARIVKEADNSIFGNVVNFPFSAAKEHWPDTNLGIDSTIPMTSNTPTLFLSGDLDCRTPVDQVDETIKGFTQAIHITVEGAGHDQVMWDKDTCDETLPAFLRGRPISDDNAFYAGIEFLPLEGNGGGHPSLK